MRPTVTGRRRLPSRNAFLFLTLVVISFQRRLCPSILVLPPVFAVTIAEALIHPNSRSSARKVGQSVTRRRDSIRFRRQNVSSAEKKWEATMDPLVRTRNAVAAYSNDDEGGADVRNVGNRRGGGVGDDDAQITRTMHLVSLPPMDDTFRLPGESVVRECWRWKDTALGDGRDYFVPRPRALKALHSLLVGTEVYVSRNDDRSYSPLSEMSDVLYGKGAVSDDRLAVTIRIPPSEDGQNPLQMAMGSVESTTSQRHTQSFVVEECAALSNCARLDVALVLRRVGTDVELRTMRTPEAGRAEDIEGEAHERRDKKSDDASDPSDEILKTAESAARYAVAYHLAAQLASQQLKNGKKRSGPASIIQTGLTSFLDLPGAVDIDAPRRFSNDAHSGGDGVGGDVASLARRLSALTGPEPISLHMSRVASGLQRRPSRPDREVIFRPYSSRDAHILLQMKRTVEVATGGRVKVLMDSALSAGKAARNGHVVPDIERLREYGSEGTPPSGLANVVSKSAMDLAVRPAVASCVARLSAMDTSDQISELRQRVHEEVSALIGDTDDDDSNDGKYALMLRNNSKKLLHEPTLALREGRMSLIEIDVAVNTIMGELRERANAFTVVSH